MLEIIKERQECNETSYAHVFDWKGQNGSGFSFECNADGSFENIEKCAPALENYRKCTDGTYDVEDRGIQEYHHRYTVPTLARCKCGAEIYLEAFTNTCEKCGRDYNMSGQQLAPRSQWGEETGEHWSECY